jgi:hypothetical protein
LVEQEEKSVDEMVAELDALATIPEDFEKPKPVVKIEEPQQVTVEKTPVPIEKIVPSLESSYLNDPVIEQPILPPPPPIVTQPRPSIDDIIRKELDRKKQQIFDKAATDYINTENKFYDNLFAMIDSASNNASVPTQSSSPIQIQPTQPQVKDNSEAIRLIEAEILDPKTDSATLKSLYKMKQKLKGESIDEKLVNLQEPSITIKPVKQQTTKNTDVPQKNSWKVGLAVFGLVTIATIAIILLLVQFHVI